MRRLTIATTAVCIAVALTGCTLAPNPNDIVYPTDIPTADTTRRPTSTARAVPVDPQIPEFCGAIAGPIVQLQDAIGAAESGPGAVQAITPALQRTEEAIAPFASTGNADIAGWLPLGRAYFQQVREAVATDPTQLSYVVGSTGDPTLGELIGICSGQPGWE